MPETTLVKAVQQFLSLPGERITLAEFKKLTPEDRDDLTHAFAAIGVKIASPRSA